MQLNLGDRSPRVARTAWVAANATVVGDVQLDEEVNVWYGAVLRADCDSVVVGRGSNIQDGCVLHPEVGTAVSVGRGVSIGHRAVVHGCTIGDHALVGMGAIVLSGAHVGLGSLIAAGSVVGEGQAIPDGMLAAGVPARVRRPLRAEEAATLRANARTYVDLAAEHAGAASRAANRILDPD